MIDDRTHHEQLALVLWGVYSGSWVQESACCSTSSAHLSGNVLDRAGSLNRCEGISQMSVQRLSSLK